MKCEAGIIVSEIQEKSPKCRQADESKSECVSRKVSELISEGYKQDQAVAIANDMCSVSCSDLKCLRAFVDNIRVKRRFD